MRVGTQDVPTRVKKRGNMRLFAPKYYESFRCIGGECTKNCCIGWEIDIDTKTAKVYSTLSGDIGERIRASISTDGGCPHFRLCDGERCANLRDDNLCSIIAECGDDMIPEICREHPRFYNVGFDFCEVGVGIACPTAAELVISAEGHRVYEIGKIDAEGDEIYANSYHACREFLNAVCDFCDNHRTIDIVGFIDQFALVLNNYAVDAVTSASADKLNIDFAEYRQRAVEECDPQISDMVDIIIEICGRLEMLDDGYGELLCSALEIIKSSPENAAKIIEDNRKYFLNLLQYFLYRHLWLGIEEGTVYTRAQFAVLSSILILMIAEEGGLSIRDAAVDYSRNVEYSDENVYSFTDSLEDTDAGVCTRLLLSILK